MTDKKICIIGGTGFVGQHLVTRFANIANVKLYIATRKLQQHQQLFKQFNNVELIVVNPFNAKQLQTFFQDCSVVINLVGILNEKGNKQTFRRLHIYLVQAIVDAAKVTGVKRFLHMSALHANDTHGPSLYLYTKGVGENFAHIRSQPFIHVTSFRPSVIFGPGDSFFNRFAGLLRFAPGVFPLACSNSQFQPIFIGDVVESFARAIDEPESYNKRYNLCGPKTYSLVELVSYTAQLLGRRIHIIKLNDTLSRLQGHVMGRLPNAPFSYDNYLSLQVNSVCTANDLAALGITPTALETIVPNYIPDIAKNL